MTLCCVPGAPTGACPPVFFIAERRAPISSETGGATDNSYIVVEVSDASTETSS